MYMIKEGPLEYLHVAVEMGVHPISSIEDQQFNSCAVCRNIPDQQVLSETTHPINDSQKYENANAICKLLHISQAHFLNYFQDCKYCQQCFQNIRGVVENFVLLENTEREISKYKDWMETSLRNNFEKLKPPHPLKSFFGLQSKSKVKKQFKDGQTHSNGYNLEEMLKITINEIEKAKPKSATIPVYLAQSEIPISNRSRRSCRKMETNIAEVSNNLSDSDSEVFSRSSDAESEPNYCLQPSQSSLQDQYSSLTLTEGKEEVVSDSDFKNDVNIPRKQTLGRPPVPVSSNRIRKRDLLLVQCNQPDCRRKFATKDKMERHVRVSHTHYGKLDNGTFKCEICAIDNVEKVFSSAFNLEYHLTRHNPIETRSWTCEICGKKLVTREAIKKHKTYAHPPTATNFPCNICSFVLSTEEELLAHNLIHTTETPFLCILCQTLTASSVELKQHMTQNHPTAVGVDVRNNYPRCFNCEVESCGKSFSTRTNLKCHMVRRHGIIGDLNNSVHKCLHCGKLCLSKAELDYHLISHSDQALFQCHICGDRMKYKKGLERHRLRHEVKQTGGKFKYECKLCPMSFESTEQLHRHEGTHSGTRSHLCDICGKGFSVKYSLNQHRRIHTNPYKRPSRRRKEEQSSDSTPKKKLMTNTNEQALS